MQRSYARVGACKQLTDEILWLVYAILEKDQEGLAAILENIETQIRWLQKRTESQ
jgi:Mg2+ and Co2+ transporter CorA